MKKKDITALSVEALHEQLATETDALSRLKFAHAISPIENPMRIREARRTIARLKTAISAR